MLCKDQEPTKAVDELLSDLPRGRSADYVGTPSNAYFESPQNLLVTESLRFDAARNRESKLFLGVLGGKVVTGPPLHDGRTNRWIARGTPIAVGDDRHHLTIAGSRAGKGRSALVPVALTLPAETSMLCIDPKGDIARLTAIYRAESLQQRVGVLDPFGCAGEHLQQYRTAYDPILTLKACDRRTFVANARLIADALIVIGDHKDKHWDTTAAQILSTLIAHVATDGRYAGIRNLVTVWKLASELATPDPNRPQQYWLEGEMLASDAADGMVRAGARAFYDRTGGEFSSVLSNLRKHLDWISYPCMQDVLVGESVDLRDIKRDLLSLYVTLTAQMETLRRFQSSELVLTAPDDTGVALASSGDEYRVVAVANGRMATLAERASAKALVPRVVDRRLATRLARVDVDTVVPISLAGGLSQHLVSKPFRSSSDYVAYRDIQSGKTQLGFLEESNNREARVLHGDGQVRTVRNTDVRAGSAMVGDPKRLMETAGDVNYLDFACLKIADFFSDPRFLGTRVCLAVYVATEADANHEARRSVDSRRQDSQVHLRNSAQQRSFTSRASSVRQQHSALRDPMHVANTAEDTLYSHLVGLGMHVVERQNLEKVLLEVGRQPARNSETEELAESFAKYAYATHVVFLDIGSRQANGDCRIAIRLVDCANGGEVLWADNGQILFRPPVPPTSWQDSSGQLVLLHEEGSSSYPVDASSSSAYGLHAPPMTARVALHIPQLSSNKVCVFRELFGKQLVRVPYEELSVLEHVTGPDDVVGVNRLRYVAWHLSKQALPAAGRIVKIDHPKRLATVSLTGAATLYGEGDSFYALRTPTLDSQYTIGSRSSASQAEERLPFHLVARDVHRDAVVVQFDAPDLKMLWSDGYRLGLGDIAQPRYYDIARVEMLPFELEPPTHQDQARLNWRVPARRQRIASNTQEVAKALDIRLRAALQRLGVEVSGGERSAKRPDRHRLSRDADRWQDSIRFAVRVGVRHTYPENNYAVWVQMGRANNRIDVADLSFDVRAKDVLAWSP